MDVLVILDDTKPDVDSTSWVAPTAVVAGAVQLGAQASVWYSAVVRADFGEIGIGDRSNIQDGSVLHADPGFPVVVGRDVTVGHRVLLHGCTVEPNVLIGMGAIIMNGPVIGSDSVIASGALVPEGVIVPPGSLFVGFPGRVRRATTNDERAMIRISVEEYVKLAVRHARQ